MPLPALDSDSLGVWLFGPGYGELVIVRAPPGEWLVVDGCAADRAGYAQKVLDHYGARPSLVVMTHPHRDHASGLREVIERATADPAAEWPRLGMVPAPDAGDAGDTWDAFASLSGGVVEQVAATIISRWSTRPASRWDLDVGSSQHLGEAIVHVVSPTKSERDAAIAAWKNDKPHDFNRAATALLIKWQGRKVVLGSDLVESPGHGWTNALGHDSHLPTHDVYKVAHHGSKKAMGPQVHRPPTPHLRTWICTPFAPQGLPKPDDENGLHKHLRIEDDLFLTGLPRAQQDQSAATEDLSRETIRTNPNMVFSSKTTGFPDCWVYVQIPESGVPLVSRGGGSVRVRA